MWDLLFGQLQWWEILLATIAGILLGVAYIGYIWIIGEAMDDFNEDLAKNIAKELKNE
jgi:hypothetical protein